MNKKILATLLSAVAMMAQAEEKKDLIMGIHLGSYHLSGDYNNFNPGLYVNYRGWTAGFYHNSQRFNSAYVGYTFDWDTPRLRFLDGLSLTTGIITGYKEYIPENVVGRIYVDPQGRAWIVDSFHEAQWKKRIKPMFVPSARFDLGKNSSLRLSFLPRFKDVNPATTVHASIEVKF